MLPALLLRRLLSSSAAALSVLLLLPDPGMAANARLSVDPVPTIANPKPGTPVVRWTTGSGAPGEVTVTSTDEVERIFSSATSGSGEAPWIQPGVPYVFKLFQKAPSRRLLATVRLGDADAKASDIKPAAATPAATSKAENLGMVAAAWAGLAALAALAAGAVRSRRDAA